MTAAAVLARLRDGSGILCDTPSGVLLRGPGPRDYAAVERAILVALKRAGLIRLVGIVDGVGWWSILP